MQHHANVSKTYKIKAYNFWATLSASKILRNLYWCKFSIDYSLKVFFRILYFLIIWGAHPTSQQPTCNLLSALHGKLWPTWLVSNRLRNFKYVLKKYFFRTQNVFMNKEVWRSNIFLHLNLRKGLMWKFSH